MPQRPWLIWVVMAMSAVVSIYLIPIDRIPLRFLPLYLPVCALLIYGIYRGARWAFVLNTLTVWIFPYETWVGIKKWPHGEILSLLHIGGLLLLFACWRFFWTRGRPHPE